MKDLNSTEPVLSMMRHFFVFLVFGLVPVITDGLYLSSIAVEANLKYGFKYIPLSAAVYSLLLTLWLVCAAGCSAIIRRGKLSARRLWLTAATAFAVGVALVVTEHAAWKGLQISPLVLLLLAPILGPLLFVARDSTPEKTTRAGIRSGGGLTWLPVVSALASAAACVLLALHAGVAPRLLLSAFEDGHIYYPSTRASDASFVWCAFATLFLVSQLGLRISVAKSVVDRPRWMLWLFVLLYCGICVLLAWGHWWPARGAKELLYSPCRPGWAGYWHVEWSVVELEWSRATLFVALAVLQGVGLLLARRDGSSGSSPHRKVWHAVALVGAVGFSAMNVVAYLYSVRIQAEPDRQYREMAALSATANWAFLCMWLCGCLIWASILPAPSGTRREYGGKCRDPRWGERGVALGLAMIVVLGLLLSMGSSSARGMKWTLDMIPVDGLTRGSGDPSDVESLRRVVLERPDSTFHQLCQVSRLPISGGRWALMEQKGITVPVPYGA